ncbi:MAG: DNA replication initiation control protein YabA [Gemmatimonadetes bacterium]|nr:DNA replication initiation control protein YabA [Gemmatimonadota bacterium]
MLALFGVLVLLALMIPIVAIVIDSPVGRALARRLEGPDRSPPELNALQQRIEVLEGEVGELGRAVESLREENQFLQKLLENPASRSTLPPPPAS